MTGNREKKITGGEANNQKPKKSRGGHGERESRGNTEERPRKAVDKSHHRPHHCFRRLQKQQLQSFIFSSHCTRNRALQERNTETNRGRKGGREGRREEEQEVAAPFVQRSAPSSPATPCCTR